MQNLSFFSRLLLLAGVLLMPFMVGCGGGGGGNTDPATLVATLCAGTLTNEDSGEQNILFASVKGGGSGITAWVEDFNGNRVANLSYVSVANAHEVTISAATKPLSSGKYTLYYSINTETFSVSRDLLWGAALPKFQPIPVTPVLNSFNRTITISSVYATPGNASYYLRAYSAFSYDYLYVESTPVPGGNLSESLPGNYDEFRIMVVADVSEGGQVVATARYMYKATSFN